MFLPKGSRAEHDFCLETGCRGILWEFPTYSTSNSNLVPNLPGYAPAAQLVQTIVDYFDYTNRQQRLL